MSESIISTRSITQHVDFSERVKKYSDLRELTWDGRELHQINCSRLSLKPEQYAVCSDLELFDFSKEDYEDREFRMNVIRYFAGGNAFMRSEPLEFNRPAMSGGGDNYISFLVEYVISVQYFQVDPKYFEELASLTPF